MPITLFRQPFLCLLVLLPLLYFPIFSHLDELPLECWDEARLAMNAHDMHKTGNWIVTTFWNSPDMWNTKPPLMIWLQAICIKIFGENELAIRLPSALAALATCMLLFWFFVKKYGNAMVGLFACVVLITSEGYVRRHGIRTGDYDSLLTFFTTAFILFWFLYLEEAKPKYYYSFILALVFASLTKGIQPLIFLPALALYTIYNKKLATALKIPHLYVGVLLFLSVIPGYYLLREHYNPGYLEAVFKNELGGRYADVSEGHEGSFWFYHDLLTKEDFNIWYILAPIGFALGSGAEDIFVKRLTAFVSLSAFLYLLIISSAATKLNWYDMPAIPLLSILVAIAFDRIAASMQFFGKQWTNIAFLILATGILLIPYKQVFDKAMAEHPTDMWENRRAAEFFQSAVKGSEKIQGFYVVHGYLEQNLAWYIALLQDKQVANTCRQEELNTSYRVIAYQYDVQKYIEDNYIFEFLGHRDNVKKYLITGRKVAVKAVVNK